MYSGESLVYYLLVYDDLCSIQAFYLQSKSFSFFAWLNALKIVYEDSV